MRRPLRTTLPLLLLAIPAAACEGGAPWAGGDATTATEARPDLGPTAAYDRRLIFLGPGETLPTAAVMDFVALSDSAGVRRGVRVRLVDGSEWIPLLDAGWQMETMREPWRLVPHGPLKLVVREGGELAAVSVEGEVEIRLEPGLVIAEHAPDAGTQLVLRQGRLIFGGDEVPGILLDAQLARAIRRAPRPTPPIGDSGTADSAAAADSAPAPGRPARPDTAAGDTVAPATPIARRGAEALLLDNSGYYAVFAASTAGEMAWIHNGGRTDVRRDSRLEVVETERFEEADADFPVRWRITSPTGDFFGELVAEAADRSVLDFGGGERALGYVLVSGWVEDRAARREVYGLVRHVR